jgi:hypothetical protein
LFIGQSAAFLALLSQLPQEADAARTRPLNGQPESDILQK